MEMKWRPIRSMADNPTESGEYLVTVCETRISSATLSLGVKYAFSTKMKFTADKYGACWDRQFPCPPIAWMPMPEPWRPEEEKE